MKRPTIDGIAFVLVMVGGAVFDSAPIGSAVMFIAGLVILAIYANREYKDYYKKIDPQRRRKQKGL